MSKEFTKEYQQILFLLRNKSYLFNTNFRGQYTNDLSCRICKLPETIEDFEHTLKCRELKIFINQKQLNLDDIYGSEKAQLTFIDSFIEVHRVRQTILDID